MRCSVLTTPTIGGSRTSISSRLPAQAGLGEDNGKDSSTGMLIEDDMLPLLLPL